MSMPEQQPISEQHGFLTVGGNNLRLSCFLPGQTDAAASGVVIAAPFGEEKRSSARMEVRLARQLAALGMPAATFDFSGTGDSQDCPEGPLWRDWVEEMVAVGKELRQQAQVSRISLVGLRAGGLVAAVAAMRLDTKELASLVLAEPFLSGAEMLAELERREKLKGAVTGVEAGASSDAGMREFGGQPMSEEMREALPQVELQTCLEALPAACPVQLLRVSGLSKLPTTWQPLASLLEGRGRSEIKVVRDKPFWGQLDYFESDLVLQEIRRFLLASSR
jgi:pimeloyl-ACP methyl ester carboxylesterase